MFFSFFREGWESLNVNFITKDVIEMMWRQKFSEKKVVGLINLLRCEMEWVAGDEEKRINW